MSAKIIIWSKAYLVAFIADDIIDEESGKLLTIYNINHLVKKKYSEILFGEKHSPSPHLAQCPVCADVDSSYAGM